jgi:hypothetical protein
MWPAVWAAVPEGFIVSYFFLHFRMFHGIDTVPNGKGMFLPAFGTGNFLHCAL